MNKNLALAIFGSAILLAISTFGLGLFLAGPANQSSHTDYHEQKSIVAEESENRSPNRTICESESEISESAFCSQWRSTIAAEASAFWAKLSFFVGAFGTAGLLATIVQGREALTRASDANLIAQEMSYNETRPWLNVLSLDFQPAIIAPPQMILTCEVEIKNYGQMPANEVSIQFFLGDIFDKNLAKILLLQEKTQAAFSYVDIVMPAESKKSTLLSIDELEKVISKGSGVFNIGIIINFSDHSSLKKHTITQMWTVGSHIHLNQLQPFNSYAFLNQGKIHPVAILRKTYKMT